MKPEIIMLMLSSLDGRLHPSRWTESPDGTRRDWSALYETVHGELDGDAWIVGRVTMAEMSKAEAHPPARIGEVERPVHIADQDAERYGIALDPSSRVHFKSGEIGGDHVIMLLGHDVPDSHLAELAADGVSYVVSEKPEIDLAAMLDILNERFGIERLLLEGGASINGHFLAAGLVDEICLLLCPAFDADEGVQGIVSFPGGLAGKCGFKLQSVDQRDHGVVQLRYKAA